FPSANSDNFDHLRWLSDTSFAFEDMNAGGDQDFNDLVGDFSFGTPQGVAGDSAPFVSAAIAPVTLSKSASTTLDLAGNFADVDIKDTLVRLDTPDGPINLELFDRQAPRTVANFLNYLSSGRYDTSIFHRSAK